LGHHPALDDLILAHGLSFADLEVFAGTPAGRLAGLRAGFLRRVFRRKEP
jgi:hypothetical protein